MSASSLSLSLVWRTPPHPPWLASWPPLAGWPPWLATPPPRDGWLGCSAFALTKRTCSEKEPILETFADKHSHPICFGKIFRTVLRRAQTGTDKAAFPYQLWLNIVFEYRCCCENVAQVFIHHLVQLLKNCLPTQRRNCLTNVLWRSHVCPQCFQLPWYLVWGRQWFCWKCDSIPFPLGIDERKSKTHFWTRVCFGSFKSKLPLRQQALDLLAKVVFGLLFWALTSHGSWQNKGAYQRRGRATIYARVTGVY